MATREAAEAALEVFTPAVPELVTSSADLTPPTIRRSRRRRRSSAARLCPAATSIRASRARHGGGLNGLSLHGGFFPFGGELPAFTDYCRPAHQAGGADGPARLPCLHA